MYYYSTIPRLNDQRYRDLKAEERWVFHCLEMTLQQRDLVGVTAKELKDIAFVSLPLLRRALRKIGTSGLLNVEAQGDVFTITDPLAEERPRL